MDREQLIAAIRATGHTASLQALEALGTEPTVEALGSLLEAAKAASDAPPDPATQTAKAAKKKSGRLPVRVGANVTTAQGKGKVTAVEGDQVTVTLTSGKTETLSVSALRAHMATKANPKKHRVPAQEADDVLNNEDSWDDIMRDVRDAVNKKFGYDSPSYPGSYCYCVAVFDGYVIVQMRDDYYRVAWSQDAGTDEVTLGDMEQVELQYVTVATEGSILGPLDDEGRLLESGATPSGKQWAIQIIEEGLSKNRNHYRASVLREAAPLYENAQMYADHAETPRRYGRSVNELVGFLKDVKPAVVGGTQEAQGHFALVGKAVITSADVRRQMVEAWEEGNTNLFGFSHDVRAEAQVVVGDSASGGAYHEVTKIVEVKSVDLVTNPAAGGRVMRLVASNGQTVNQEGDVRMLEKMIAAIKASKRADLIAALEALGSHATEDAVMALHGKLGTPVQEAVITPPAPAGTVTLTEAEVKQLREDAKAIRKQNALLLIANSVAGCALPVPVRERLGKRLRAMVEADQTVTEEYILAEIKEDVEAYGKVVEGDVVVPGGGRGADFRIVKSTREQVDDMLDDFFGVKTTREKDPRAPNGVRESYKLVERGGSVRSFRRLYIDVTGDDRITGEVKEATRLTEGRLTESLSSSSFSNVLGDSITRRMVAEYQLPEFQVWRGTVAIVAPLNDFRTQHRMRFGGYGNFPTVAQGAPYLAMTSPTDEEATYTPAKRGGTEAVTLEMIKNDDVGVIRRIPMRLGRAAGQTLYEFVFDFMRSNAAIYDSTALAAAGHGNNISTTALSASQIANGRLVMRQQTDMSSGKRLGIMAKYLWLPTDLEDLGRQITGADAADRAVPDSSLAAQAAPAAPNPNRWWRIQPMAVDYWTDTNNWWLSASVNDVPMIEVGFLDGREDPELFVQDQPNVGSLFTNDAITWKVRHIYGGVVEDFRGFFGGIVP